MAVQMQHDGIDEVIEVAEISVPTYERSGWRVVGGQTPAANETKAAGNARRQTGEN
ncbi:hypothetical protein ACFWJU_06210 [Streptomyces mutabilis]|uniref:hypothetical protein n=1 Tax=Streptomyces mutabilis TaxID=67332 RepID=UPI00365EBB93